jgi:proteasome lid subunit RPN8/RPN11
VTIAPAALDAVRTHAAEARPRECCGLLVGVGDAVLRAVRAGNLAPDPDRYLIDPADHVQAIREARAEGLDVVGFYHSHPHSAADPSPTDLAEASYPGSLYLIAGVRDGRDDVRMFRLRHGVAEAVPFSVVETGPA